MKGFDPRWRDPPDYILGVTRAIWEDRGVHLLRDLYTETIPVRTPAGVTLGNEAVIAATLSTLAEFPDRTLLGEDVIWSEHEGPEGWGFLSSHRLLSTATHLGSGGFGAPTGRTLRYRIIADCYAVGNRIADEWLIRDYGAVVRQMGFDPREFAARRIEAAGGPDRAPRPFTPERDVAGPYDGRGNGHPLGARYAELLARLMAGDLAAIPESYDRAATLEGPGGEAHLSWAGIDRFWLGLRAAFPRAEFRIHHAIGREDAAMPPRAALRWSLDGRHEGSGAFGAPTGARVHVMGLSHAEFGPWGLRREWVVYDETAIWTQILLGAA